MIVEFYLQDLDAAEAIINDADFQKLQSEEAPWIDMDRTPIGATLGWVEVYVDQGKIVNITDGKPSYTPLDLGEEA